MQAILWEVHIQHEVIIIQLSSARRVQVVQDVLGITKIQIKLNCKASDNIIGTLYTHYVCIKVITDHFAFGRRVFAL